MPAWGGSFEIRTTTISKALYFSSLYGQEMDTDTRRRVSRVRLAKEFGWTLDYVDSLDAFTLADVWGVLDGMRRIERTYERRRQQAARAARGRHK